MTDTRARMHTAAVNYLQELIRVRGDFPPVFCKHRSRGDVISARVGLFARGIVYDVTVGIYRGRRRESCPEHVLGDYNKIG